MEIQLSLYRFKLYGAGEKYETFRPNNVARTCQGKIGQDQVQ